jgi:hypothetical protein
VGDGALTERLTAELLLVRVAQEPGQGGGERRYVAHRREDARLPE